MTTNFDNTPDNIESVVVHRFIVSDLEHMYLGVNEDPSCDKMDAFYKTWFLLKWGKHGRF